MGRNFKAPARSDDQQWRMVKFLHAHGFSFQTVYDGSGKQVRYPETLDEAKRFVLLYSPQAPSGVSLQRTTKKERSRSRQQ